MNKINIENLLNQKNINKNNIKKLLNKNNIFYILMCCDNCKNQFVEGGCCSQSYIEPVKPIKLFTKKKMIEYIEPVEQIESLTKKEINVDYSPFIFITLEEYLTHF
jgi:hypothetical protein